MTYISLISLTYGVKPYFCFASCFFPVSLCPCLHRSATIKPSGVSCRFWPCTTILPVTNVEGNVTHPWQLLQEDTPDELTSYLLEALQSQQADTESMSSRSLYHHCCFAPSPTPPEGARTPVWDLHHLGTLCDTDSTCRTVDAEIQSKLCHKVASWFHHI